MNYYLRAVKMMFIRVLEVLTLKAADFASLPDIVALTATLKALIDTITAQEQIRAVNTKGITKAKQVAREQVVETSIAVLHILRAYAGVEDDYELIEEVNLSDSKLKELVDEKLTYTCRMIKQKASTKLTELTPYGLSEPMLLAIETSCKDFDAKLNGCNRHKSDRKSALEVIEQCVHDGEVLLSSKIDLLAELLKTSKPETWKQYFDMRRMEYTGSRTLAMRVQVFEAGTDIPVPYANVLIEMVEETNALQGKTGGAALVKHVKRASEKGGCQQKLAPDGTYKVTGSKSGFFDNSSLAYVSEWETAIVRLELRRKS